MWPSGLMLILPGWTVKNTFNKTKDCSMTPHISAKQPRLFSNCSNLMDSHVLYYIQCFATGGLEALICTEIYLPHHDDPLHSYCMVKSKHMCQGLHSLYWGHICKSPLIGNPHKQLLLFCHWTVGHHAQELVQQSEFQQHIKRKSWGSPK